MSENNEPKKLWWGQYCTLWESGEFVVTDGVGHIGREDDIEGLYEALKEYFEEDN